jgi:hypothetical protein
MVLVVRRHGAPATTLSSFREITPKKRAKKLSLHDLWALTTPVAQFTTYALKYRPFWREFPESVDFGETQAAKPSAFGTC